MLKKLVSALALTGLAFGSGLCFNPYNHDYGISTEKITDNIIGDYNKTIILHDGKMQVSKDITIELVRYITKGNKALVLMRGKNTPTYFIVYTECTHREPVTVDLEMLDDPISQDVVVNIPRYPIKLGFYKDGFWVKALHITWVRHFSCNSSGCGPGGYVCDYETDYYPYKLIKEHKTYDAPSKDQDLPTGFCQALGSKYGL